MKKLAKPKTRVNSARNGKHAATAEARQSIDKHVGSRVRLRCMMLGLSQTNIGDAIGVTFQQVQKYERGTNRISASRLHYLAKLLKVQAEFFFEREAGQELHNASSPDYVTEFLATSEGLALVIALRKLPTGKLRRSIVALVQELADEQN